MTSIFKLNIDLLKELKNKIYKSDINSALIEKGLKVKNLKTGKEILFPYSKVFNNSLKKIYGYNELDSIYCFIKYTQRDTSASNEARFKKSIYTKNRNKHTVNGYPFDMDKLCFLPENISGNQLKNFINEYIDEILIHKAEDSDDLSFLDELDTYKQNGGQKKSQDITQTNKENKMNRITQIAGTTMDVNKEAMKLAAKLEVGKIATAQLKKVVKPKLPMMVRGYADSPLFDIVLANAVGIALREYAPGNDKAQIVSEAMIQSAAVEMMSSFNINDMLDEMLSTIDVSKITSMTEANE